MPDWVQQELRQLFPITFAGEWGEEPSPATANVLRATDIDDNGSVVGFGAPRKIAASQVARKALQQGDILLEASGGSPTRPVGRVAFLNDTKTEGLPFLTSNFFKTLRASGAHDPKFLAWKLLWYYQQSDILAFQQQTTGIINLKFDEYLSATLQVPQDKKEEETIAHILDTLYAQIRRTEEVIAKLKQVKQGLLTELLTRGIDENGELRPAPEKAPELYKDSPLGRIPRAWECDILGNVTEWFSGGTPNRAGSRTWQGSVPFLTPKDMKRLTMEDTSEHVTMEAAQNASRLMEPETVFLVVRGMILAHTFPVCINEKPFAFNQDIKGVRATDTIRNRYLGHWFAANTARFLAKATASTHGTKKLDLIELHRTAIAFPPLTEQDVIIRKLAQMDETIAKEKSARDKLLTQKPGLMDDLLTGRVRVTPLLDEAAQAAC